MGISYPQAMFHLVQNLIFKSKHWGSAFSFSAIRTIHVKTAIAHHYS